MGVQNTRQQMIWEGFNATSHGIGVVVGLVFLLLFAVRGSTSGASLLWGNLIYVIAFMLMFLTSTLYHALPPGKTKKVLRVFDHSAIFIFIAGTYTPVALYVLDGYVRLVFLVFVWLLALTGVGFKMASHASYDRLKKLSVFLYLAMGWLALFFIRPLVMNTSLIFLTLVVTGGVLYSVGTIFYRKKAPYSHTVWHIFVLTAALCHLVAIYGFMR